MKASKWNSIAKNSVQKKNDRGDTIVIYLEGTSHERPLSDDDFIKISPFLKLVRETRFPQISSAYLRSLLNV